MTLILELWPVTFLKRLKRKVTEDAQLIFINSPCNTHTQKLVIKLPLKKQFKWMPDSNENLKRWFVSLLLMRGLLQNLIRHC